MQEYDFANAFVYILVCVFLISDIHIRTVCTPRTTWY